MVVGSYGVSERLQGGESQLAHSLGSPLALTGSGLGEAKHLSSTVVSASRT